MTPTLCKLRHVECRVCGRVYDTYARHSNMGWLQWRLHVFGLSGFRWFRRWVGGHWMLIWAIPCAGKLWVNDFDETGPVIPLEKECWPHKLPRAKLLKP